MAMKFSYLLEFMTINIVVSMPDGTWALICARTPANMGMAKFKSSICMEPASEVLHLASISFAYLRFKS